MPKKPKIDTAAMLAKAVALEAAAKAITLGQGGDSATFLNALAKGHGLKVSTSKSGAHTAHGLGLKGNSTVTEQGALTLWANLARRTARHLRHEAQSA